ncbi:hypothetical protein ACF0H5_001532 [Mactra antiquata]
MTEKTPNIEVNSTNHSDHEYKLPASEIQSLHKCSIRSQDKTIAKDVKRLLLDGTKVIEYTLQFNNSDRLFYDDKDSKMYRPFFWVRATGRHGTSLLALRPEYDKLSLYALAVGVKEMNVTLVEEPALCLNDLTYTEIEKLIRELVMNDFESSHENTTDDDTYTSETVCNKHIIDDDGVAEFQYFCCVRDEDGKQECKYLHSDFWLNMLLGVIITVKVLVVLYSPKFIPERLYHRDVASRDFVFRHKKKLKVIKTVHPSRFENAQVFHVSKFDRMEKFKETLDAMNNEETYEVELAELNILVKHGRLLTSNDAPVGLFQSLIDAFLRCKISERDALKPCCSTNVFLCCKCCTPLSWRTFLRRVMKILLLVVIAMPWVARIYVYYEVEDTEMELQKEAAEQKSLDITFPGNTTLYLSPVHVIFIVIYAVLIFEVCIFKLMGKRTQERFKLVMVKCLSDMRDTKQMDVIGWLVKRAVAPCTAYGVIGIIVGLFFWVLALPFCLVIVAFYTLPTFNISVRMMFHFIAYLLPKNACRMFPKFAECKKLIATIETKLHMETFPSNGPIKNKQINNSPRLKCEQLISILMCSATFIAVIFLLMEFTAFIIEVLVYVFMGIIVNADQMLTYLSLAFLMGVYAQDCFGFVSKKFLNFNESLNHFTLSLGVDQVRNDIYLDEHQQKNIAVRVRSPREASEAETEEHVKIDTNIDGLPRWNISKLCLFLDNQDIPYIPRGYFFHACTEMSYEKAPGQLVVSYLRACAEMCVIIVFLLFVLIVVLAFGDTYELSAGNKMLATIAGGILPFLLRNVVFKAHDAPKISKDDAKSILFQSAYYTFLKNYKQTWPMSDINVANKTLLTKATENDKARATNGNAAVHEINESEESALVEDANSTTINNTVNMYDGTVDMVIDIRGFIPAEMKNILRPERSLGVDSMA